MDPGDLDQRLQVPTGSKRPNPAPFDGEEDREIKKFRTDPSNVDESSEAQRNGPLFPFFDFPCEDFFDYQSDTVWSNQDVHGGQFSTTTRFNVGFEGSAAPSTGGNIDYTTNFSNFDVGLEVGDNSYQDDSLGYSNQAIGNFMDGYPPTGTDYAEQSGSLTAGNTASQAQFQDALFSQGEFDAASQSLLPEVGVLRRVESMPIRHAQVVEPGSQKPAATVQKQSTDVHMDCDTCFGVVGYTPTTP